MLDDGLIDGLDAALLFHPGDRDMVGCMLLASEDVDVTFTGKAAHAAGEPWEGRNALDAVVLLLSAIGLWRQQLPQHARVHGIVREGGTAANIIPDRATARFMIRSTNQAFYESMRDRFRALVAGAAMMADVTGEAVFSGGSTTMKDNAVLAGLWRANLEAAGRVDEGIDPEHIGSSDMGNVSLVLPTIHPTLAICDHGVPWHSIESRDAAATPRADETTLLAATLVAQTALDLLADPSPRRRRLAGVPRRGLGAGAGRAARYHPRAPRWTADTNRRRPHRRPTHPATPGPSARSVARSPGGFA